MSAILDQVLTAHGVMGGKGGRVVKDVAYVKGVTSELNGALPTPQLMGNLNLVNGVDDLYVRAGYSCFYVVTNNQTQRIITLQKISNEGAILATFTINPSNSVTNTTIGLAVCRGVDANSDKVWVAFKDGTSYKLYYYDQVANTFTLKYSTSEQIYASSTNFNMFTSPVDADGNIYLHFNENNAGYYAYRKISPAGSVLFNWPFNGYNNPYGTYRKNAGGRHLFVTSGVLYEITGPSMHGVAKATGLAGGNGLQVYYDKNGSYFVEASADIYKYNAAGTLLFSASVGTKDRYAFDVNDSGIFINKLTTTSPYSIEVGGSLGNGIFVKTPHVNTGDFKLAINELGTVLCVEKTFPMKIYKTGAPLYYPYKYFNIDSRAIVMTKNGENFKYNPDRTKYAEPWQIKKSGDIVRLSVNSMIETIDGSSLIDDFVVVKIK